MWDTAGRIGTYVEQSSSRPKQAEPGKISKSGGLRLRQETALDITASFPEKHSRGSGTKVWNAKETPATFQSYGHGSADNDAGNLEELQNQAAGATGRNHTGRDGENIHDESMHYRTRARFP